MTLSSRFTDEVRTKLYQLADTKPLLVVEGKHDKAALMPFLARQTEVLSADGKEKLLAAYRDIEPPLRNGLLFVMDCDGTTPAEFKGQVDLVLTTNRDIESDVILQLNPAERAGIEIFGPVSSSSDQAHELMALCIEKAAAFSGLLGVVLTTANELGLLTRFRPAKSEPRGLAVDDFVSGEDVGYFSEFENVNEFVEAIGDALRWDKPDAEQLLERVSALIGEACKSHQRVRCVTCVVRRGANGHHFVQGIAAMALSEGAVGTSADRVGAVLRASTQVTGLFSWPSLRRIRIWQDLSGWIVLKSTV